MCEMRECRCFTCTNSTNHHDNRMGCLKSTTLYSVRGSEPFLRDTFTIVLNEVVNAMHKGQVLEAEKRRLNKTQPKTNLNGRSSTKKLSGEIPENRTDEIVTRLISGIKTTEETWMLE